MLFIDPETVEYYESHINDEVVFIEGNKYYAMSKHVFAVITYRIHRACQARRAAKIELEVLKQFIKKYILIGNIVLKTFGTDWIDEAENEAESQLRARS